MDDHIEDFRRSFLADLIFSCRAREHRKGRGDYRQEAVATRIGISRNTYSEIEGGSLKPRHNHVQLLTRLADDLKMSHAERRRLFVITLRRDPPGGADPGDRHGSEFAEHCEIALGMTTAALVYDERWNILFENGHLGALFPSMSMGTNIVRWVLTSDDARQELVQWRRDWAEPTLEIVRTRAAETGDARIIAFYREIADRFGGDQGTAHQRALFGGVRQKRVGDVVVDVRLHSYAPDSATPSPYRILVCQKINSRTEPAADSAYRALSSLALQQQMPGQSWRI